MKSNFEVSSEVSHVEVSGRVMWTLPTILPRVKTIGCEMTCHTPHGKLRMNIQIFVSPLLNKFAWKLNKQS